MNRYVAKKGKRKKTGRSSPVQVKSSPARRSLRPLHAEAAGCSHDKTPAEQSASLWRPLRGRVDPGCKTITRSEKTLHENFT
jgi:hypothetical protein